MMETMKYIVEKAKVNDAVRIQKMVNGFAGQGNMLPRSLAGIYENIRDYYVVRNDGGNVIGCAALHVAWEDMGEIRSVAVSKRYQRRGVGAYLINACLGEAGELGLSTVFCLTYRPEFFTGFGFKEVDKHELPRKVWVECYYCPKFPDCDETAMLWQLGAK
jgi:amino-acid N-acetyltransferase